MHTIVVHLDKKMYDWYLIEPFLYKVQSLNTVTFLDSPVKRSGELDYRGLEEALYKLLYQQVIDDWQLIFLLTNSKQNKQKRRLRHYLEHLREEVLYPLQQKQIGPEQTSFFMLDPLTREKDLSPTEDEDDVYWQLDTSWYVLQEKQNYFSLRDLEQLDAAWKQDIKLADAGLLNEPKEEFVAKLEEKANAVREVFHALMDEKRAFLEREDVDMHGKDVLSVVLLNDISEDFSRQLERTITPPLSSKLEYFQPSGLLKEIVKIRISVAPLLAHYRFFRLPFHVHSSIDRTLDLIRAAMFLHICAHDPALIREAPRNVPLEVHMEMDEQQIKEMLQNYSLTLEEAQNKIESILLSSMITNVHKFSDIKVDSIQIQGSDKLDFYLPNWNYQNNYSYKQTWNVRMEEIEEQMEQAEDRLFASVHREVMNLTISKRRQFLDRDVDGEQVEIQSYSQDLHEFLEETQLNMSQESPNHQGVLRKWQQYKEKKTKELWHRFRFFPNHRMVVLTYLVIALVLLVPYYFTVPFSGMDIGTFRYWNALLLTPAFVLLLSVLLGLIVRQKLRKPIAKLIEEVEQEAGEYANSLKMMPKSYETYLKNLYRLFHMRRQFLSLNKELEEVQRKNVLLRYHQSALENNRKLAMKLLQRLNFEMNYAEQNRCRGFVNKEFNPEKVIYENKVYSPLDSPFDSRGGRIEVSIRDARYETNAAGIGFVKLLRLQKDQVYNV